MPVQLCACAGKCIKIREIALNSIKIDVESSNNRYFFAIRARKND